MAVFYINGVFVDENEAVVPARDLAVLRGYGAFDYLRTYNGKPFRLARNIERLRRSCAIIGLDYPWEDAEIAAIVAETLARNPGHADYNIRLVITGGISPDNITPTGEPGLLVMVTPLHTLPAWWYSEGVKVVTFPEERAYPNAKSINYISGIVAQRHARENDGIEALYVDRRGNVTEGTTTNIFAFYGDQLVTPDLQLLPGITRQVVLELAEAHYAIHQRALPLEELLEADEVFITAANKRIVPVVQIDETRISAQPGQRTRHIMALFDAITLHAPHEVEA